MNCPKCSTVLEPITLLIGGWKCPADSGHTDLLDEPGLCGICKSSGRETELVKFAQESHTYRCPKCEKTILELMATTSDEYWLKIEFESLKPGLAGVFIADPVRRLATFIEQDSRNIAPCQCGDRWGLIRIGQDTSRFYVNLIDACCEPTKQALERYR
jgi:hypothetical protein